MQTKESRKAEKLYSRRASMYERVFIKFLGWGRELENFFGKSQYIRPAMKILDAGCGTGAVTKTAFELARKKNFKGIQFHAFDLTRNMLDVCEEWIAKHDARSIEVQQADVLHIETLPHNWNGYDLVISSTMLEYLPKDKISLALMNLGRLLKEDDLLLIFITRRNRITRWLAGKWWRTNLFDNQEIQAILDEAGFSEVEFKSLSPGWSDSIFVIEAKKRML